MTIGSMVLKPGDSTKVWTQFTMHAGMEGFHNFKLHLITNDPLDEDHSLTILSNWVP